MDGLTVTAKQLNAAKGSSLLGHLKARCVPALPALRANRAEGASARTSLALPPPRPPLARHARRRTQRASRPRPRRRTHRVWRRVRRRWRPSWRPCEQTLTRVRGASLMRKTVSLMVDDIGPSVAMAPPLPEVTRKSWPRAHIATPSGPQLSLQDSEEQPLNS